MSNLNHGLGGRLPMLKPGKLQTKQRELYDKIIASVVRWADAAGFMINDEQDHLIGPFNATLYSPEMGVYFAVRQNSPGRDPDGGVSMESAL